MNGVDNMLYMSSVSANNGQATLYVDFDVKTNADTDQVLSQLRVSQAQAQLPAQVNAAGVVVQKSLSSPLMVLTLSSPDKRYDVKGNMQTESSLQLAKAADGGYWITELPTVQRRLWFRHKVTYFLAVIDPVTIEIRDNSRSTRFVKCGPHGKSRI